MLSKRNVGLVLILLLGAAGLARSGSAPPPPSPSPFIDSFGFQEQPDNCYSFFGHVTGGAPGPISVTISGVVGPVTVTADANGDFAYGMQASAPLDGYVYAQATDSAGKKSNTDQDYIIP